MALTLYYHPLASFCHKVLIALYENNTPFTGQIVDFSDEKDAARFLAVWPVGKIPVLRDSLREAVIPETSIILEYLQIHFPGPMSILPKDRNQALDARLWDRFYDCYVMQPMQKIVVDRLRPEAERDARGVAEARQTLRTAYAMIEKQMDGKRWGLGDVFSIIDCSAAPALFYAECVEPFSKDFPQTLAYFNRLFERPSFHRVLSEAKPFFENFPYKDPMPERFRSLQNKGK